jgi:predicted nuclease with TOPRIM domain
MSFEQKKETITNALQEKRNAIKTKDEYIEKIEKEVATYNEVVTSLLKPIYMLTEKKEGNITHVSIATRLYENSVFSLYNYTIDPKGITVNTSGYTSNPDKVIEALCTNVFTEARVRSIAGYLE